MLATEAITPTPARNPGSASQETWALNERMRHVPRLDWMLHRLDVEIRRRAEILLAASIPSDHPIVSVLDGEWKGFVRALDRLAEVARHERANHYHPNAVEARVRQALEHAVAALRSLDADVIGRRGPFHHFEKSKSEPLYGALLVVMNHLERIVIIVRTVDLRLDEHLLEGLVVRELPLNDQVLKPIA